MGKRPQKLIAKAQIEAEDLFFDLSFPLDVTIPIDLHGPQVNCYYGQPARVSAHTDGTNDYILEAGSTVNSYELHTHIHCNGTHTESAHHILQDAPDIFATTSEFLFVSQLVTVDPQDDKITADLLSPLLTRRTDALIIRTLPNTSAKKTQNYSGKQSPYFAEGAMNLLVDREVRHLLVDLPSVDSMDSKELEAHHSFFVPKGQLRPACTITELLYIPHQIPDGIYLVQLGLLPINVDASPSRVILYPQVG